MDELRDRRALHLVLIERLHGGKTGGGAGLGAFVHGACFNLNRHPGEGRDLNLASEMDGETPAFAGVTMKG